MRFTRTSLSGVIAAVLPLAVPMTATAQEALLLDEIVISGGLTPIEASAYGRAYSSLDAAQIEARGLATVQDALRALPGVSVNSTGDTFTQIRIRGGEGNHTLVLIDGVEAAFGGQGEYMFSGLETADIERIEILRGPQSTLYGSNAMGGVIAITTRRASQPGTAYSAGVELGSDGTKAGGFNLRQSTERSQLSFSASARHVGGYDPTVYGGRKAANDRETLNLTGQTQLTDTITAGFTLRRSWQDYVNISTTSPVAGPEFYLIDNGQNSERNEVFGSVWAEAETLGGRLSHRLALSGNKQDTDTFNADGSYGWGNKGSYRALKYRGSFALDGGTTAEARHLLNFAAEAERETFSAGTPDSYRRDSTALALEYQGRFDWGLDVQAGLRHDFNEVFRDATTWSIGLSYALPDRDIRLRGSVGKAIVNPTMYEQFGYVPGVYDGNPDLRPERSLGADIGVDFGFAGGRGQAGVTLFHGIFKDEIRGAGTTSINETGESRRRGVELSGRWQMTDSFSLSGNYTFITGSYSDGRPLIRRPGHELGLSGTLETFGGRGSVTASLRHVAGNYDSEWFANSWPDPVVNSKLPDFTTVNLSAHYSLTDDLRLTARVVNLFDTDYSEAWGYPAQGRTVYVGLRTQW